jgi:hypothetical protein
MTPANNTPTTMFPTAKMKRGVTDAAVSAVQINLYATTVLAQPPFEIDGLPELDVHLLAAQGHANYWTSTLTQELVNSFADVIDYGTTFNTYYTNLSALAAKIPTDPDAKASFLDGIMDLRNQIRDRLYAHKNGAVEVVGIYALLVDCRDFRDDLGKDFAAFQADSGRLDALIAANPDIQSQIDALNANRKTLIGKVVIDVLSLVGGIILIIVGAVATFATDGLAVGLVLMGATLVATGGGNLVPDAIGLADLEKQYGVLLKKQAEQSAESAALLHTKTILTNFVTKAGDAQQAISNIITGWEEIANEIDRVAAALNGAKDDALAGLSARIMTDLKTAKDEWTHLVDYTTALQTRSKLTTNTPTPA